MAGYADVVASHAKRAMALYKNRAGDLQRLSGLSIAPDGTNNAKTREDVVRYLKALEQVGGPVAIVSARLVMKQAAKAQGLDDKF